MNVIVLTCWVAWSKHFKKVPEEAVQASWQYQCSCICHNEQQTNPSISSHSNSSEAVDANGRQIAKSSRRRLSRFVEVNRLEQPQQSWGPESKRLGNQRLEISIPEGTNRNKYWCNPPWTVSMNLKAVRLADTIFPRILVQDAQHAGILGSSQAPSCGGKQMVNKTVHNTCYGTSRGESETSYYEP